MSIFIENWPIFGPKNVKRQKLGKNSDGKSFEPVGNASICLKMGKNVPYGIFNNPIEGFFYILLFYNFTAAEIR